MNQRSRDYFVLNNALFIVNILKEGVEGEDPLFEAPINPRPLFGRDNPGNQIKWKNSLRIAVFRFQGKGNAHLTERALGRLLLLYHFFLTDGHQLFHDIGHARARRTAIIQHFIKKTFGLIHIENHHNPTLFV